MQTHQQETPKAEQQSGKSKSSDKAQAKSDKPDRVADQYHTIGKRGDEALNVSLKAKQLTVWWTVGEALEAGHKLALHLTKSESGQAHEDAFNEFLKQHRLDEKYLGRSTRDHLVRCIANREAIDKWLEKSKEDCPYEKRRTNNPILLWGAFSAANPGFAEKNIFGKVKKAAAKRAARHSAKPRESLKTQVDRLEKENEDLTKRAKTAEAAEETLKQQQNSPEQQSKPQTKIAPEQRGNPKPETVAGFAEEVVNAVGMVFAVKVAEHILGMHAAKAKAA